MLSEQLFIIGGLSAFAILSGLLASKFRQPFALALMIVGAVIGPNVLGLLDDPNTIDLLIEFGAVLFLFSIGLEFSLKKLLKTGPSVLLVTTFKVGIMFFLGFITTILLGFDTTTAAFVGVALSFSSTMIILNVLKQKGLYRREEVPLIMGVLILEDIFGVIALTFLASPSGGSITDALIGMENLILGLLILAIIYILASAFAERIIRWLLKNAGDETIIFMSIGLCTGMGLLAYLLGLSPGAGAFLAGSVASTFRQSKEFERSIHPYSYILTSFFFIGIGTMFNLNAVLESWHVLVALGAIVLIGLPFAMGLSSKLFAGFTNNQAFFTSAAMLPPGIFSLLVAKEAVMQGLPLDLVSIISTLMIGSTILMSLIMLKTSKIALPLGKRIEGVADNLKMIFNGLLIETTHTKDYSNEGSRLLMHLSLILLPLMVLLRIAHHVQNQWLNVIAVIAVIIVMLYGAHRAKKTDKILRKIILHNASRTAVHTFRKTQQGLALVLIGVYSPFFIYLFSGSAFLLIISVAIVFWGYRILQDAHDIMRGRARVNYKPKATNYKQKAATHARGA